jgi:hypothetical protein
MSNYRSLAPTQSVEVTGTTNHFTSRIVVCLVLTVLNAIAICDFAGTLYRVTAHNALQQAGVTSLFAALLGSLARVWLLTLRSRTR